ncbi:MAG: ABC transporter ATP-binding protein [Spirochaetales bacterium]|nr:ABC transporter ATP-binding protein [Spirochaetales bacterium]MCR5443837.1 ABC transporter ATP-binding protein [Sphaerochaetaceae bacterium]MBQ3831028.1 ABC transporter ATP-binding protein [Spirochaetales bacterium]MBQ7282136.1 ABC transporter ATP-binding protein [Spirochaetales bacterium]MBQ7730146.1 ABC transporter ATP-binding protein [Spirochaetales bacterium]
MHPIELVSITKRFKAAEKGNDEITILQDLNLSIVQGQSTAIIGKSGSGKSTLLHIAGGLDSPTEGKVICSGTDFATLDDKRRSVLRNRHIGFIFQANLLLEDFSALENVMAPALISGVKARECKDRAVELLERLGLADRMDHVPGKLSGGEKQRVAICRALMNRPEVILADEPTGALDEENASEVENLLLDLVREEGRSLLLVTHNQDFAFKCDNVYLLKNRNLTLEKEAT